MATIPEIHRCTKGGEKGIRFEKFGHKHRIKGDPLDFVTPQVPPAKEFGQNPKDPPPPTIEFPTTVHLRYYQYDTLLT
jgi:hypothetical protein